MRSGKNLARAPCGVGAGVGPGSAGGCQLEILLESVLSKPAALFAALETLLNAGVAPVCR